MKNDLPQETTVHWHRLALPNEMDGVPVLTQPAIAPGGTFTYEFAVPDAGTYYIHSHVGTQLDRGMYGPLIIEDPADGRDYADELVVVLDRRHGHAQLNLRVDRKPAGIDVGTFVAALRTVAPLNTSTLTPAADVVLPQRIRTRRWIFG